jgi:predicted nucleic acid-binding protein
MRQAVERYVLDSSAWLTLIEDEAGAGRVQELLEKAKNGEIVVLVSFMSFMEVYYITVQERGQEEAQKRLDLMTALPVLRVESTETLSVLAGRLKADHRLSVADAWIAALAQEQGATLVHKDPEFEQVEGMIPVLKLPYKSG